MKIHRARRDTAMLACQLIVDLVERTAEGPVTLDGETVAQMSLLYRDLRSYQEEADLRDEDEIGRMTIIGQEVD